MRLYFDIETDRIDPKNPHLVTKAHCILFKAPESPVQSYYDLTLGGRVPEDYRCIGSLLEALERMSCATELVGHNIIGFDLPVLKHLYNWEPKPDVKIIDTYVMSCLLNPDRRKPPGNTCKGGPHSLEAWGCRLGKAKPDHEDWSVLDTAMLRRCGEDVGITELTYLALQEEARGYNWKRSLELEHQVARIEQQKELYGVNFDKEKGLLHVNKLYERILDIDDELLPNIKPTVKSRGVTVDKPFTVKGSLKKTVTDWFLGDTELPSTTVGGPFTRIEYHELNLGSPAQVKAYLLENEGWIPDEWNYDKKTGLPSSARLTESSLSRLEGNIGKLIRDRSIARHRKSQIEGWLKNLRNDNRLTAGTVPCGTNTGRMRHILVANVPKAKDYVFFGQEMRELFTHSPGRLLVGHDASGLELRMLAHYMDDPEYIEAILHGDIHTFNQHKAGLPDRDSAKTFIYAFLYGAGNEKLGSIVGGTESDGAQLKRDFLSSTPKLDRLIKNVKRASKKGYLKGLDGRKTMMRRDKDTGEVQTSKALNTLLQGAGGVVMKEASCILDYDKREANLDAWKVIDYHDEQVNDVIIEHTEPFAEIAVQSIIKAGTCYDLRIPLNAEAKTGRNWAEIH